MWQALRAGRFAGFKFRRQHHIGPYFLDFYCPQAKLAVELDGFCHGLPMQRAHDNVRRAFLSGADIEELRFWNHHWRRNRQGVLLDIWRALYRRTGCLQVMRKEQNNRFVAPTPREIGELPFG
jgi:very-short-patch-repair endonuclease